MWNEAGTRSVICSLNPSKHGGPPDRQAKMKDPPAPAGLNPHPHRAIVHSSSSPGGPFTLQPGRQLCLAEPAHARPCRPCGLPAAAGVPALLATTTNTSSWAPLGVSGLCGWTVHRSSRQVGKDEGRTSAERRHSQPPPSLASPAVAGAQRRHNPADGREGDGWAFLTECSRRGDPKHRRRCALWPAALLCLLPDPAG